MPTIAQRLCEEIVEPSLKKTSLDLTGVPIGINHCSGHSSRATHTPSRYDGRASKSISVEKKNYFKSDHSESSGSRSTKNYKSKEILIKRRLRDIAINTFISGPLQCDNDCVTMIRKKPCKCTNKQSNSCGKETQTFANAFNYTDKACNTVKQADDSCTRGTQFLDIYSSGITTYNCENAGRPVTTVKTENFKSDTLSNIPLQMSKDMCWSSRTVEKLPFPNFMGARRWALSKYPTRGADF